MRRLIRHVQMHLTHVIAALAIAVAVPAAAAAVTPEELIELGRSGLGDEVLLALIDTDGVPAAVDPQAALRMRTGGLSDRVIAAAVRSAARRQSTPPEPATLDCSACESNIAVIGGQHEPAPVIVEREVYYVPWLVPVPAGHSRPSVASRPYFTGDRGFGRFINAPAGNRPVPREYSPR